MKRLAILAAVLAAAVVLIVSRFPQRQIVLAGSIPDGTIPGVLHIHSVRSDGRGTPEEIAQAAGRAGLRFIILTDHGDATRPPDAPVYRAGVLCIDGVEISTTGGHYVVIDMAAAPYPLGGEARDVVEDVKRLGGFGIAAHPDSPKPELRWRDWGAPFDGIEIVNLDTSWRRRAMAAPWGGKIRLVERLLSYRWRPAESIASLIQPTSVLAQWEAVARRRRLVTIAGADAHAQIAWRSGDPIETRVALPLPGYEASFRALSVHVRPERALTGDASTDAGIVFRAIRAGHLYIVVDGAATPPSFELTAANAHGTVHEGDQLGVGGPVTLHVRSNAPSAFTTTVWNGATVLSGGHHEQDFSVQAPEGPGLYWVDIRATGRRPDVPWIMSNAVYVRAVDPEASPPGRPPAVVVQPLVEARSLAGWRIEHDPASLAAVDIDAAPGGSQAAVLQLRFGLSGGAAVGQYAALVVDTPRGLEADSRVAFTVRAEHPMRLSVQLRTEKGRWQRSVYVDTFNQERTVFFDEMVPVGGAGTDKARLSDARSLLFVVDSTNTKPGTSGRVWITEPQLQH